MCHDEPAELFQCFAAKIVPRIRDSAIAAGPQAYLHLTTLNFCCLTSC